MTLSYIGASSVTTTIGNQTITPHASTQNGDLLIWFHYTNADTGTEAVSFPGGWTEIFNSISTSYGLIACAWHIRQSGETTYTSTVTNHTTGTTGDSMLEWIETYRGADSTTPIGSVTASNSTWSSSLNIGSITEPSSADLAVGDMVIVWGGRCENVTGQTLLTGQSLTWEVGPTGTTTTGRDAGSASQHGLNETASAVTLTAKTITTTGTAQAGAGRMFIVNRQAGVTITPGSVAAVASIPTPKAVITLANSGEGGGDAGGEGTVVTQGSGGNSGGASGSFFDLVAGSPKFRAAAAIHGSWGYDTSMAASATVQVGWSDTGCIGQPNHFWGRTYFKIAAAPPVANLRLFQHAALVDTVSTLQFGLAFSDTANPPHLAIRNFVGGTYAATSTSTITLNTWHRVEYEATYASGTPGTWTVIARLFLDNDVESATPTETLSPTAFNASTQVSTFYPARWQYGAITGTAQTWTVYHDEIALSTIDWLGPAASPDASVAPGAVAATVAVPAPTVMTDVLVTPGCVSLTASVPTSVVSIDATAVPACVLSAVSVTEPGTTAGGIATPDAIAALTVVPSPVIETDVLAEPGCVTASAGIPSVTVTAESGGSASVTPACVTARAIVRQVFLNNPVVAGYVGTDGSSGIQGTWQNLANAEGSDSGSYATVGG